MDELTKREIELLKEHRSLCQELLNGDIQANDDEKIHFLRVFKGPFSPNTELEIAYKKYLSLQSQRASEAEIEKTLAEIEQCPAGCRSYTSQMNEKFDFQSEPDDPWWNDP